MSPQNDRDLPALLPEVEGPAPVAPSMLPALRADLAPLIPTVRRAATIVAAVAVTDWALRTGSRAILQEGLHALGRGVETPATPVPRRAVSEILIVERVTLHRSS